MNLHLPVAVTALVLITTGCSIQIGTAARPMGPQSPGSGPGHPPQRDPAARQQVVQRERVEIREGMERQGPGPGAMEAGSHESLHLEVRAHPIPDRPGTYRLHATLDRKSAGHSRGEHSEEHDHMELPPLEASVGGEPATSQGGPLRLTFRVVEESGRLVGRYELGWKSPDGEGMMRSGRLPLDPSGRPAGPDGKSRPGRAKKPGKDGPGPEQRP